MNSRDQLKLRVLGRRYAIQSEKYHNGDIHSRVSAAETKAAHSEAWGREAERTAESFTKYAEGIGLKASFNGLYPSVEKDGVPVPLYQ